MLSSKCEWQTPRPYIWVYWDTFSRYHSRLKAALGSLQQDLTQLSIWSDTWKMCHSIPKCKALNISRKKIPTKQEYRLNGSPLATVSEIKDLGITVTNTLQGSQHIKRISSKANRTLGLIRRVCRDINDPDIKIFYTAQLFDPRGSTTTRVRLWTMVTLHVKRQTITRKCSAQGHKVYLELCKEYFLQESAFKTFFITTRI